MDLLKKIEDNEVDLMVRDQAFFYWKLLAKDPGLLLNYKGNFADCFDQKNVPKLE